MRQSMNLSPSQKEVHILTFRSMIMLASLRYFCQFYSSVKKRHVLPLVLNYDHELQTDLRCLNPEFARHSSRGQRALQTGIAIGLIGFVVAAGVVPFLVTLSMMEPHAYYVRELFVNIFIWPYMGGPAGLYVLAHIQTVGSTVCSSTIINISFLLAFYGNFILVLIFELIN